MSTPLLMQYLALAFVICLPQSQALTLSTQDENLLKVLNLLHSSNELELFTELNGATFVNDHVLTQLSASRIVLGDGVDQVSFRWQDTPTDQDPDGLSYMLGKYVSPEEQSQQGGQSNLPNVEPVFSIPKVGHVPATQERFNIKLNCTGGEGRARASIEIFIFGSKHEKEPTKHSVLFTLEKQCSTDNDKDAQVAGCDHAKSPKKMCKKLCGNLPADELAKIYCNASMILVGTFRKSRNARNKCESRHILVDWKMKRVSERNLFIRSAAYTKKKFSVLAGSLFRTCKCLRRMKKDKRYIFVGDFDESSWALRLTNTVFMAKRNGVAKRVLEDVDCAAVLGQS